MTRVRLSQAALLAVGILAPLRAQDFRIELFSKRPAETLTLRAGEAALRLCDSPSQRRCLVLAPGATAQCACSNESARCVAGETQRRFGHVFATSALPFRLETAPERAGRGEPVRNVTVRAAEVLGRANGVRAIVTVDLETYVAGVLAGEGAALKSSPALAAMAIVARTWAMRWRGRHRPRGFDFCSLTHCQFVRLPPESNAEVSPIVDDAVRRTSGLVLKYRGQIIDPYYCAHCGGVTEAAGEVWPDRAAPYLRSVADPYCVGGAQSAWQQTLSLETVETILRRRLGIPLRGSLRDLTVEHKTPCGRVRALLVRAPSSRRIDANEFRYAVNRELGWNTLKSNLYTVERRGDSLFFVGHGLGHGVGLCQTGAEQMGQMGIAYERILAHYFPGTTVEELQGPSLHQVISSEHFELLFPAGQQPWADETLHALEAARRELGGRADILSERVRVRTWETTEEFIHAAGQPGWVAASNDGRAIELQPIRNLKRKGILSSTLRHELTHLAVRRLRAPEIPRWYEEGLVLYLTGEQTNASAPLPAGRSLEESISRPRSEAEMKVAYWQAHESVKELSRERGETALWQVLQHPSAEDLRWLRGRGSR